MKADHLFEMANDIGNFFKSEPDHEASVLGVYDHIKKFWEYRMQTQIVDRVSQTGGSELQPHVLEAIQRIKADLEAAA